MVVALVPGEPGDADRFPFLPETLRRVAKKVWNRCCVSAGRRYVFGVDLAHRTMSTASSSRHLRSTLARGRQNTAAPW
jgi:hypothetical protein